MPETVKIGALVLGAVLLLIGIVGGNFKIFGADFSSVVENKCLRWVAALLGIALLVFALDLKIPQFSPTLPSGEERTDKRETILGRWRITESTDKIYGSTIAFSKNGQLTYNIVDGQNGYDFGKGTWSSWEHPCNQGEYLLSLDAWEDASWRSVGCFILTPAGASKQINLNVKGRSALGGIRCNPSDPECKVGNYTWRYVLLPE